MVLQLHYHLLGPPGKVDNLSLALSFKTSLRKWQILMYEIPCLNPVLNSMYDHHLYWFNPGRQDYKTSDLTKKEMTWA